MVVVFGFGCSIVSRRIYSDIDAVGVDDSFVRTLPSTLFVSFLSLGGAVT